MQTHATENDPVQSVMRLATQFWQSQQLFVANRLEIADVIGEGALTCNELASRVGAQPGMIKRLLRALAPLGVFAENEHGRFRNTAASEVLKKDHPSRAHHFVQFEVSSAFWQAFGALEHTIRTGENAFTHVHGVPFFAFLEKDPELEGYFADTMTAMAAPQAQSIARAYPFGIHRSVVDLGGSNGNLVAEIVRENAGIQGVLFDLPSVVERALSAGYIGQADVQSRITVVAGSMLECVPPGHDCYIVKNVIHDWDDDLSIVMLKTIRKAMTTTSRVLLAEFVVPSGNDPDWSKQLDIAVLVGNNGQERTRDEYESLLNRADLSLVAVHPTTCGISLLEAAAS